MSERRRALGRGLGALIPSAPSAGGAQRPVDVFFPEQPGTDRYAEDHEPASTALPDRDGRNDVPHQGSDEASPVAGNGGLGRPVATALKAPSAQDDASDRAVTSNDTNGTDDGATNVQDESGLVEVPGARFAEVPVESVEPNARQPRQVFDEDDLDELAASIREVGVLQPVVVRPNGTGADGQARYELIMGERRWRASRLAGAETVPAIIRDTDSEDMLRDALLENLHRAQLNPLEEAAAYQQLLDDFDCTHEELASRIARSRPQISNTLRLLKLPPLVQRRVAAGVLSAGHARALLGLSDGAAMERMAQRIVAEGLSVRATEELVTLGEEPMRPEMRRRPRAGAHSAALDDLSTRLSDQFDTKVKVALGQRKGRINIEFASVQDLNRILEMLSPADPGLFRVEEPQPEGTGTQG
ncbi:ParB/RepB/Spo0J family partition protein [Pseudactinotalea sp. Z1739]|uniref:ParB/RepB/Spo0J family partition protein n=1 Tax=Pseudactinotalea sp. Z1739 TaxID=3413028 RepID=UPI003C7D2EB2